MATKQVYHKATVIANESHEVSQRENEPQDTITKQKDEAKDRKKTNGIWTYFEIDSSESNKVICLTCKKKISRGGSKPTKFNTSNLCKHLMIHKDEYKHFVDEEKKREERTKKQVDILISKNQALQMLYLKHRVCNEAT